VNKAARGWVGSLALLAVLACRREGDPVRQTLDRVAGSASERDVAGVAGQLAADYRDAAGNGRSDVEQTLRGYFAAYESLDVTLREVSIERAEGAARARFRVDFSGRPRKEASGLAGLLPSSASYRFDVRLVPDGSQWTIAWASWEPVER
jgi:hypothetical protein